MERDLADMNIRIAAGGATNGGPLGQGVGRAGVYGPRSTYLGGAPKKEDSMRLDLAFLGRDCRPITVSPAREIERRAAWGAIKEDVKFLAAVIGTVAVAWTIIVLWGCV